MIYCRIKNGVVVDRATFAYEMPEDWPDFEQWVRNDEAQIGWVFDDGELTRPIELSPDPLFPAPRLPNLEPDQFWFVVRVSGHEDDLTTWLDALREEDPVAWAAASSKLQFAKFFERDHPFVEAAREALGITSEELDTLWRYAS